MTKTPIRPSEQATKWAAIAEVAGALVGGIVGLVVGLVAYPPAAGISAVELGIPSAFVGGLLGLVVGTIASGFRTVSAPAKEVLRSRSATRKAEILVAFGTLVMLDSLWRLDWARAHGPLGKAGFIEGPTGLLAFSALASLALSVIVVVTRLLWPRSLLCVATVTTLARAAVVSSSSMSAARHVTFGGPTASLLGRPDPAPLSVS